MSATSPTAPKPATRNDAQRQAILDAASSLFIEKGYAGTNLNDIADAVGVTRTALYYYFTSKESILGALTEDVTEQAGKLAQSVSRRNELPAEQALRELIVQHATLILTHPVQFRVVERSEASLPAERRQAAQVARRSVLANFVHVIERGVDEGRFVVPDARIAAFAIIGMCNWSAWWFDPEDTRGVDGVAQMIAELGLRSVLGGANDASLGHALRGPLAQIRTAVEALERQVAPRKAPASRKIAKAKAR